MIRIDDIKTVEAILDENHVDTLSIRGRYMNHRLSSQLYVDDMEQPMSLMQVDGLWHTPYTVKEDKPEELRKIITAFGKGKEIGFTGLPMEDYEIIKDFGTVTWEEKSHQFYYDGGKFQIPDSEFQLTSVREEELDLIYDHYTYREEDTYIRLKEAIQDRLSVCARNESGEPVSWVLIHPEGTMGVMHTLKAYRGKGLAQLVSKALVNKMIDAGMTPYLHIVDGNEPSVALAKSLGFKCQGYIMWFVMKID